MSNKVASMDKSVRRILYYMPLAKNPFDNDGGFMTGESVLESVSHVILSFLGSYHFTKSSGFVNYTCDDSCAFDPLFSVTGNSKNFVK